MSEESFIKTPKQLAWAVGLAIVVPVIVIVMLASFVASLTKEGPGGDALTPANTEERIAPVAKVEIGDGHPTADALASAAAAAPKIATGPAVKLDGPGLFNSVCIACHGAGVAGAPKFGDKAAWAPRIAQGMDTLVAAAIHGIGAMPPKGGSNATDDEIRQAVKYMTDSSK
jgi:cytochrome c5